MAFSRENDPFDIVEHRVREVSEEQYLDDMRIEEEEDTIEKIRAREPKLRKKEKAKSYNWAFFLFSLFTGLGITATIDAPLPLFLGLGIGFLFFVDPIYEAVMRRINRL